MNTNKGAATSPAVVRRDARTRIDNPLAALRAEQATVLHGSERSPPEIELVPHSIDGQLDGRLSLLLAPDSARSVAFRVLRHHLIAAGRPQVVLVSSPRAGEGKTTLALNLALALGECGRAKVLLVETPMRKPQLADIIGRPPAWCFADQLLAHRSQPRLPWSAIDLTGQGLHVALLSPSVEHTQLFDGVAFAIAMEQLRLASYDHIIVDTTSVLDSAEVNLMIDAADALVLAVRARRTTGRDLQRAIEQLATPKLVGTVLMHG